MKVIILSGIPGSGKSTWVDLIHAGKPNVSVVSTDAFFYTVDAYEFDPSKLGEYHSHCFNTFLSQLANEDVEILIVDNTNLRVWERQNYVAAAQMAGVNEIEVHFFIPDSIASLKVMAERNVHGVSPGVVAQMAMSHESQLSSASEEAGVKARYRSITA